MYNINSCIFPTTNFQHWNFDKKQLLYNTHWLFGKNILDKFTLNSTFVQLFIWFISTKNENIYSLYDVLKHKIGSDTFTWKCNKLSVKVHNRRNKL